MCRPPRQGVGERSRPWHRDGVRGSSFCKAFQWLSRCHAQIGKDKHGFLQASTNSRLG